MAKKSSKKPSKEWESYEPTMHHAPQRSVLQEGRDALTLMEEAYPRVLSLNERFGGAFARNEADIGTQRAAAEASGIRSSYGQFREALLSSPEVARANTGIMDRFDELGASEIEQEMSQQALGELRLGGALSAEEARNATQSARAAFSARGLATGSPAAVAEVLSRDSFARQRQAERRAFAGGVDRQSIERKTADSASANNLFNTVSAFWDPQMRIFGRGGSQVSGQVTGPSSFAPFLGAAQNVGAGNQAAAVQTNWMNQTAEQFAQQRADSYWATLFNRDETMANAAAQRRSNTTNAALGAVGSIAGMAALAFL